MDHLLVLTSTFTYHNLVVIRVAVFETCNKILNRGR